MKSLLDKKTRRLRRAIFHNKVYMLTTSVESGIMLPANPLVKSIVVSALLKAHSHHPIKISHFIVNATHLHLLVRVVNPQDIPKFMERFKTESAHYINRLLGRKKRTVWCERYDMQAALEWSDVVNRIIYIYNNPVKDGLIESIERYPGLSSWSRFKSNKSYIKGSLISREAVKVVDNFLGEKYFESCRKQLFQKRKKLVLDIDPNDWMLAFPEIEDKDEINKLIIDGINENREDIHQNRLQENKINYMGSFRLRNQGIDLSYVPQREGVKFWCYSANKSLRQKYISFVKKMVAEAEEVYEAWCRGDTRMRMPVGMFAPRMPVLADLIVVG